MIAVPMYAGGVFSRTPGGRLASVVICGVALLGLAIVRLHTIESLRSRPADGVDHFIVGALAAAVVTIASQSLVGRGGTARVLGSVLFVIVVLSLLAALPFGGGYQSYPFPPTTQLYADGAAASLGVLCLGAVVVNTKFRQRVLRGRPTVVATASPSSPSPVASSGALFGSASSLDWLQSATFALGPRGYRVDQVDRFIAECVERSRQGSLTAAAIRGHVFSPGLKGYVVTEVDAALERAARQLEAP